jgi:hypothetical protein
MLHISAKLRNYLQKVSRLTGRPVAVYEDGSDGLLGMQGCDFDAPPGIRIPFDPDQPYEFIEYSIAQAATLGLLAFGKGFRRVVIKMGASQTEEQSIRMLVAMVDYIPTSSILQQEDFKPYSPDSFYWLEYESAAAFYGIDVLPKYMDLLFKQRFQVFRYMQTWTLLRYISLGDAERNLLLKYEDVFRTAYPKQIKLAHALQDVIMREDPFTAAGNLAILKAAFPLWGLEKSILFEEVW